MQPLIMPADIPEPGKTPVGPRSNIRAPSAARHWRRSTGSHPDSGGRRPARKAERIMSNDTGRRPPTSSAARDITLSRRNILVASSALAASSALTAAAAVTTAQAQQRPAAPAAASGQRPNILVIFGDDIGVPQISAYTMGMMGYRTPNIDRIAREGAIFTDAYGQQSCTAGRASFILGQEPFRTGLLTIGMPG